VTARRSNKYETELV